MKTVYTAPHGHADVVLAPNTAPRTVPGQLDYFVRERRRDGSWVTYELMPFFFAESAQHRANEIDSWAWRTYRREDA